MKLPKGLLIGGVLGAGLTWLSTTKKGRAMRDQIIEHAAVVYTKMVAEIRSSAGWKQLSQSEYVERVQAFVHTYAVETGLSTTMKRLLEKVVIAEWSRFQKEKETDTDNT